MDSQLLHTEDCGRIERRAGRPAARVNLICQQHFLFITGPLKKVLTDDEQWKLKPVEAMRAKLRGVMG